MTSGRKKAEVGLNQFVKIAICIFSLSLDWRPYVS